MASRTRSGERAAVARTGRLTIVRSSRVARALTAHEHRTAAGLLALFVLVYLWPALVEGDLLAPTALLYLEAPWSALKPAGIERYMNGELGDVPLSFFPWSELARELVHAGTFPAWNPYALGGTPFFANAELAWLSPFSLLSWTLPASYAPGAVAALKLWVAAFGTYLLARELRLGFWPGVLAGVSFGLCAFNVVWLTHGVQVSVAALLPWSLWLAERIVRRGRPADGLALAAVVALVLTGGHPGTQLHVLAGAALYALVRAGLSDDVARRDRVRRLATIGGAFVVGALLAAVVLLPAQQAAVDTVGEAIRRDGGLAFPGSSMSAEVLRTALFPDWWGRPTGLAAGPAQYKERTFYAGVVALLLALVALVSPGGWRRKAPFAVLAAVGIAVPVHVPGIYDLFVNAPLFERVQNQRILVWFLLAVAILGAFGLQALLDGERRQRRAWGVIAAAALAGLIAAATLELDGDQLGEAARYFLDRSGELTAPVTALASIGWWLLLVAGVGAIVLLARRRRSAALVGGLAALLAALDLLHFAHGLQPMGPASRIVPPRTPAIAYLQRHAGDGRIAGVGLTAVADWTTIYRLRDVRGNDAPQPSLRFARLWYAMDAGAGALFTLSSLDAANPRMLGALGAGYLIARPGTRTATAGLRPAYRGRDAAIFSNAFARPRASVAERVLVAGDEDAEIAAVAAERFDPRRDAVVRGDELAGAAPAPGGRGAVRVVDEQNATVTLRARLPRAGLVVLTDAWAPGWSVEVDGRPARALQTDVVLRGVVVPAGTHEVVWRYRVPGLRLGAALSAIGALAALGWGAWLLVRARRRTS